MSNLLIKETALGVEKIFPKNYILNLVDKESGKTLLLILNSFNMFFLNYIGNKADTRKQVPTILRKLGLWITYVVGKTTVTEWYNSQAIDDTTWGASTYWVQGSNMLVGDVAISANGTWVINGLDTGISPKGDKGETPLIRVKDNLLLVSYDNGTTYNNLTNTPVYTKFRFNSLTNTYLVSYDLGGTWQDISDEKVYHKFRYNNITNTYLESIDFGKTWSNISAEKVYYLFRYNAETNTHLVSTDLGLNWTDVSSNKVYYQFRTNDNRLLVSTDLGNTWENCSEPIAAWFRWADTSGTGNVGKILISRDNKTWSDLSPNITNNLYIKGYVAAIGNLPSNAAIGDIYMVGPTYDESDTAHNYPHYRMWVKLSSGWVDNGEYLSNVLISLTTGLETGITMSLKAITGAINVETTRAKAAEEAIMFDLLSLEQKQKSTIYKSAILEDGNIDNTITSQDLFIYDVVAGDKVGIQIYFMSGVKIASYAFYNSTTTYNSSTVVGIGEVRADTTLTYKQYSVTVPKDAVTLIVTKRRDRPSSPTVRKVETLDDVVDEVNHSIDEVNQSINKEINEISDTVNNNVNGIDNLLGFGFVTYFKNAVVQNYLNPTYGQVKEGTVGEPLSVINSNNWKYKKYNASSGDKFCIRALHSANGVYSVALDANENVLQSWEHVAQSASNPKQYYQYLTMPANTAYFVYSFPSDVAPFACKYSDLPDFTEIHPEAKVIEVSNDGVISTSTTMNTYRIPVKYSKIIKVNIRLYSGNNVVGISYWDKSGNMIAWENKMGITSTDIEKISIAPDNAIYALITTRNNYTAHIYIGNFESNIREIEEGIKEIEDSIQDIYKKFNPDNAYSYFGERLNLRGYTVRSFGKDIIKSYVRYPNQDSPYLSGQGCAIYGNNLFRFHQNGLCDVFDISDVDNVTMVSQFELGSYYESNHANTGSFGTVIDGDTNMPYLYVSGGYNKKCYVEKVTTTGSTLVQTITLSHEGMGCNFFAGNDGYLWCVVIVNSSTQYTFKYYKFIMPAVNDGDVSFTADDAIDSWTDGPYDISNYYIIQGGKVINGRLFICFGVDAASNHIIVWNTDTKEQVNNIPLSGISSELEDFDVHNGNMIIVCNGDNQAYLADFM